ncbi:MAG: hypothetical protein V2B18_20530 [Pseudomonadota bacterium]
MLRTSDHGGSVARRIASRIQRVIAGQRLVGASLTLTGVLVARMGIIRLLALYRELAPYFPISLTDSTSGLISQPIPWFINLFITVIGSICAVLVGLMWVLSGLADALGRRGTEESPGGLQSPELVAESMITCVPRYGRSAGLLVGVISRVWPGARFISPATGSLIRGILLSVGRIILLGFVIAVIFRVLQEVPWAAKKLFQRDFLLSVPYPKQLYALLGLTAAINLVMGLSLLPFTSRTPERTRKSFAVHGRGDPQLFFSLLEEGCKLLTPRGKAGPRPVRLERLGPTVVRGTLIENAPSSVRSPGRIAAYGCIPLMILAMVMGFSRLIHFAMPVQPVEYTEFLSRHFLNYIVEIAFAFALILTGLHFAERAGILFGIRRYASLIVFFSVEAGPVEEPGAQQSDLPRMTRTKSGETAWEVVQGVDQGFARWVRDPSAGERFLVEAYWAQAESEAASDDQPRYPTGSRRSKSLDLSMERILELPFLVTFSKEPTEDGAGIEGDTPQAPE